MLERKAVRVLVLALTAASVSGCVSINFKEPITTYAGTMSKSTTGLRQYYIQLNSYERELYLQRAYYDPTMRVALMDENGIPTGLSPQFSPEGIQARLNALDLLTAYTQRLIELAGAEAPKKFNTGAQTLGTKLQNLDKDFQELEGKKDPSASKYIAPVSAIIGAIGEMYLDRKREAALNAGITNGSAAITAILNLLERDMIEVVQPLQKSGAPVQLAMAVDRYNRYVDCKPIGIGSSKGGDKPTCLTSAERSQALNEIRDLAMTRDSLVVNQPVELIKAMRDAHAALLKYASAPKDPQSLASLTAALELFNSRVEPIANAIAAMEEA